VNHWITKKQILELIKVKTFKTEDEFRDYLAPQLVKLFGIKESQVEVESKTTSFDQTLSNRCDIVIRTDDAFRKAIIVIELKLARNIEIFEKGDYENARKQLHKYSQDTRAPYGILLTEEDCFIYKNKYFSYDQKPKREQADKIPPINKIEDKMALYALLDFLLYKKSMKYLVLLIFILITLYLINKYIIDILGLVSGTLVLLVIFIITGVVMGILSIVFKIFD